MGSLQPEKFTGINKIINSNLSNYKQVYSYSEVIDVLHELRELDLLSKSTSLDGIALIQPLIVKICEGHYA